MKLGQRIGSIVKYGFEAADIGTIGRRVDDMVTATRDQVTATSAAQTLPRSTIEVIEPKTDQAQEDRILKTAGINLSTLGQWKTKQSHFINNCQLISIASALAKTDSGAIRSMVKEASKIYRSKLTGIRNVPIEGDTMVQVTFQKKEPIFVTPRLDYISTDFVSLRFAAMARSAKAFSDAKAASTQRDGEWISFVEKAYAILRGRGGYMGLDYETPSAPDPMQNCFDLWGHFNLVKDISGKPDGVGPKQNVARADASGSGSAPHDESAFFNNILKLSSKRPTVATTPYFDPTALPVTNDFVGMHTYVIKGFSGPEVSLWEPLHLREQKVAKGDFFKVFEMILQRADMSTAYDL
jgi:hypothetical protein